MNKLSVVIPVFNSKETISEVVHRVEKTAANLSYIADYEIILVNDGSKDGSEVICKNMAEKNKKIKFVNLSTNFGQHKALIAGYRFVSGDYVIKLDDDLQIAPEDISILTDEIFKMNYDVVYATFEIKEHSYFRKIGSAINSAMASYLIGKPKNLKMTSFYIMKRFIVNEIAKYEGNFPYTPGIIFKSTNNIGNIPIPHYPRKFGSSNYSYSKLLSLWFNGFTNFSVKPLRVASILGMLLAFISIILTVYLIVRKITVPGLQIGWTSIMVSVLFLGSIQLLCIGLLGEYVGRTFLSLNKLPQYVIRDAYNVDEGEKIDY